MTVLSTGGRERFQSRSEVSDAVAPDSLSSGHQYPRSRHRCCATAGRQHWEPKGPRGSPGAPDHFARLYFTTVQFDSEKEHAAVLHSETGGKGPTLGFPPPTRNHSFIDIKGSS